MFWSRILGVDLGTANIKAVLIAGRRVHTAKAPAPPAGPGDRAGLTAALSAAVAQLKGGAGRAVTALSGDQVVVRFIKLPLMTGKELRSGLQYEAERYLPVNLQEYVLDWVVLRKLPDRQMLVMLAAAPRELAYSYYELFQAAGLTLLSLDVAPLALLRSLAPGREENAILLDVGAGSTQIVVAPGGCPEFSRLVTLGLNSRSGPDDLALLVQEVRRSLEFYRSQTGNNVDFRRLILAGGGAYLPGIKEYLQEELGFEVDVGPSRVPPEFALAYGLALRR
ncbi:MAG: type pilus assembly protein PilM [Clostridia bacterium]|nr:type pilus assembly protein PilM [Clostridia bacterium]